MSTTTTTRVAKFAGLAAALALPLTFAACGSSTTSAAPAGSSSSSAAAPSTMASPSMSSSPSMSASTTDQPFGAACSAVPESGKGSFDGMSQDPVATAASNNPLLSTLVSAVQAAGLVDTLNGAKDITVFAPTNDAFEKVPAATLKKAMADEKGLLTDVLTAHVVSGRLTPADLAGEHQTLTKDAKITVEGSGEDFTVNGDAMVLCGNVQTANATVYIVDSVLLPKS
jgi:uncharacterized surface protein with fasciclin (FAS1) repeats